MVVLILTPTRVQRDLFKARRFGRKHPVSCAVVQLKTSIINSGLFRSNSFPRQYSNTLSCGLSLQV